MVKIKRLASIAAVLGLAIVGVTAMPHEAKAWWRGGYGYGVGIWVPPPVIVAPPYYARPIYAAPPAAYYPPPRRFWVPPHWEGPYWVRGHWS
jgi:hypothetical protein